MLFDKCYLIPKPKGGWWLVINTQAGTKVDGVLISVDELDAIGQGFVNQAIANQRVLKGSMGSTFTIQFPANLGLTKPADVTAAIFNQHGSDWK
jgi:hypothetical protein